MGKLEVNKCYALLSTPGHISEVTKIFPSDNANFANFFKTESIIFKTESISLRHHVFGKMQVTYLHEDVTRDYVEISEEEYQKFYHLWEVYCKSLETARLKLEKKLNYGI